jgi:oleate hydratase
MPEDFVFTVEYSVHGAMLAVYTGVDHAIPPIYHGLLEPKVGKQAPQSMFK